MIDCFLQFILDQEAAPETQSKELCEWKANQEGALKTYAPLPKVTQLIDVIIRIALWMKDNKVHLAIECFDAIHYKLLPINIMNSNQLMTEIHNNRLYTFLRNVQNFTFNQQSILKIAIVVVETKRKPAGTYNTQLQEVSHLNTIDDDKELDYSNIRTNNLQEVLLNVSLDMKTIFPIRWINEVFHKFLSINTKSPDVLCRHIIHGTLN